MPKKLKQQQTNHNLFETASQQETLETSSQQESFSSAKIDPTACPQCGGKSLASVRPQEYAGLTHYCPQCKGEEAGEPYRFTPGTVEELASQSFEENELQAVAQEIETEEVSASKYDQEKLFVSEVAKASGKTLEALEYSRERATEVMRMFDGHLPQSIMKADKKSRGASDLATRSYTENEKYTGAFAKSSSGARYGALSAFPQNIGKAVVLLYSKEGDTIVDPFAGHNSRMELCVKAGRNYIGCDISKKFMEFNREQRAKLLEKYPNAKIGLHEIDSRKMSDCVEQWAGDFTLTSPPYYNIEDYGDEHQQLGKAVSYAEFLRSLRRVAEQNFRALKSGSFCCWFVNDFRDDGCFNAYHIDTFNMLCAAGFVAHDIMIVDFGGSFGQCFPAQVVDRKILPKRHEYGIVMRKL